MPRKRREAGPSPEALGPFRLQHMAATEVPVQTPTGVRRVTVNAAESPLAWLARRKDRNGQALITPVQLQAGERLRADFTAAMMTPRVTSSWDTSTAARRSGGVTDLHVTDRIIAARRRVGRAMDGVGPEFAGLMLDVCCFLKGLEDVERERTWPPRSAKLVLQLGLDRLARHYGLLTELRGRDHAAVRAWSAETDSAATEGDVVR
jgi:hypothetical protein